MNPFMNVLSKVTGWNVAKVTMPLITAAALNKKVSPTDAATLGIGTAALTGAGTHVFQATSEAISKKIFNRSLSIPVRAALGLAGAYTVPFTVAGVSLFACIYLGMKIQK